MLSRKHYNHHLRLSGTSKKSWMRPDLTEGELHEFIGLVYGDRSIQSDWVGICCISWRCNCPAIRVVAGVIRSATDLQRNDKSDLHFFQRSRGSEMPGACSLRP